jgi:hypothetical protein
VRMGSGGEEGGLQWQSNGHMRWRGGLQCRGGVPGGGEDGLRRRGGVPDGGTTGGAGRKSQLAAAGQRRIEANRFSV